MPDARWLLALRLEERLQLSTPVTVTDAQVGRTRLERWREALGADADRMLTGRVESAGGTMQDLERLLGEPTDALRDRALADGEPAWLTSMLAAFAPLPDDAPSLATLAPGLVDPAATSGFLTLVQPGIVRGIERIRAGVADTFGDIDDLASDLAAVVGARLQRLLERPLATEVQSASLLGLLDGDTPGQRFGQFVQRLADPAVREATLLDYPVLARLAAHWIDQWVTGSVELLQRLASDRAELARTFGAEGAVTALRSAGSDVHKDGRHVWFVEFDGGPTVVYKPRPFRAEAAFQRFVERANALGLEHQLRVLAVVDRTTHGWIEFVEHAPCASQDEVVAFHRRLGAWMALLHVVGASDLHNENLIASGAHPVPVDHETILRCQAVRWRTATSADDVLVRQLGETVLGTDLLPNWRFDAAVHQLVDHSGVGAAFDAFEEVPTERMVGVGTDEMYLGRDVIVPTRYQNRASLDGEAVHARDHLGDIDAGMVAMFRLLGEHRDQVAGWLREFEGATVRMVLRPTMLYMRVLTDLQHPWNLADGIEGVVADATLWSDLPANPWRAPLLASEVAQCAIGDVPWLGTRIGSGDIVGGDGAEMPGAVATDGLETCLARAALAGTDDDLARHRWILAATLGSNRSPHDLCSTPLAGTTPLELATAAGDLLGRLAITTDDGQRATWLTAQSMGDSREGTLNYRAQSVDADLYDGLHGIALFLAELAAATGDERYADLARAALATLDARGADSYTPLVGAYSGWGGRIVAQVRLARLLDRPDLLDQAEAAIPNIVANLDADPYGDIVGGAAGAVLALLELDAARPESGALAAALECGEQLAARDGGTRLTFSRGFSHGPAGAVLAFARLHARTRDGRWRSLALAAATVERERIRGGWADADNPARARMCAWCHGAAGIALGRLEAWHVLGEDALLDDARAALEATVDAPVMTTHCLCHGRLGNLETLQRAAELLPDERWRHARDEMAAADVADIRAHGAGFPTPGNFLTPGLMTGLAGIGLGLLRIAEPDRVRTVLAP